MFCLVNSKNLYVMIEPTCLISQNQPTILKRKKERERESVRQEEFDDVDQ